MFNLAHYSETLGQIFEGAGNLTIEKRDGAFFLTASTETLSKSIKLGSQDGVESFMGATIYLLHQLGLRTFHLNNEQRERLQTALVQDCRNIPDSCDAAEDFKLLMQKRLVRAISSEIVQTPYFEELRKSSIIQRYYLDTDGSIRFRDPRDRLPGLSLEQVREIAEEFLPREMQSSRLQFTHLETEFGTQVKELISSYKASGSRNREAYSFVIEVKVPGMFGHLTSAVLVLENDSAEILNVDARANPQIQCEIERIFEVMQEPRVKVFRTRVMNQRIEGPCGVYALVDALRFRYIAFDEIRSIKEFERYEGLMVERTDMIYEDLKAREKLGEESPFKELLKEKFVEHLIYLGAMKFTRAEHREERICKEKLESLLHHAISDFTSRRHIGLPQLNYSLHLDRIASNPTATRNTIRMLEGLKGLKKGDIALDF